MNGFDITCQTLQGSNTRRPVRVTRTKSVQDLQNHALNIQPAQ